MVAVLSVFTGASAPHFQGDFDLVVRERDVFHAADFDAGHFHAVAHLEVLRRT